MIPLLAMALLSACGGGDDEAVRTESASTESAVTAEVMAATLETDADVVVYKSPTCGCCTGWVDHLREAGFTVETVDLEAYADLSARKRAEGVPADLGSCHTAVVDGYTVEGHVPAAVIERLLRERPEIRGIAVPGMPVGSPGMEGPDPEPYEVVAFTADGRRHLFTVVDPTQPASETR